MSAVLDFFVGGLPGFPWFPFYAAIAKVGLLVYAVSLAATYVLEAYGNYRGEVDSPARATRLRRAVHQGAPIVVALAALGFAIGHLAGNSRQPVADTVITAAMTVYGGLALYWFGQRSELLLAAAMITVFGLSVHYGVHAGSVSRTAYEREHTRWRAEVAHAEHEARRRFDAEVEIEIHRQKTLISAAAGSEP